MALHSPEKNNKNKQSITSLTDQIDKELDRIRKESDKERERIALANKKERERIAALEGNAEKIWSLTFDQADKKQPGVVTKFANKLGIYLHIEKTVPYPGSTIQGRNLFLIDKGKKIPVQTFYANKTDKLTHLKTPRRVISEVINATLLVAAKNGLLQVLDNKKRREISAELNSPYIRPYLSRIQLQFALEMLNHPVGRPGQRPSHTPGTAPSNRPQRSTYQDRINSLRREARTSPTKNKELRSKCLTPYTDPVTKVSGQQFTARGSYRNARLSELYTGKPGKTIWIKKAANLDSKDPDDYMKLKLESDGEYHAVSQADREVYEHGWNRMPVKVKDVIFDTDPTPYLKPQDESISEKTEKEVHEAFANFAKQKLSVESVTTLLKVLNIDEPKVTLETVGQFQRLRSQGIFKILNKKIELNLQARTKNGKESLLKLFMITRLHAGIHIKNVLEDLRKRFNGINIDWKNISLTDKTFSAYKTINGSKYTFNFAFTVGKKPSVTLSSITKEVSGKTTTKSAAQIIGYNFFKITGRSALETYLKNFFTAQVLRPNPQPTTVAQKPRPQRQRPTIQRPRPNNRPGNRPTNHPNNRPTPITIGQNPITPQNRPQQNVRPTENLNQFSKREIALFIKKFNDILNPQIRSRSKSLSTDVAKLRMEVTRNNFRIEKAQSGEHQILLTGVTINGKIGRLDYKNFKVEMFPLVIGLKENNHTFSINDHFIYAISAVRKRIAIAALSGKLRASIERKPQNDPDLKQLHLTSVGTLIYKGKPVYNEANPLAPSRYIGIEKKKLTFTKRNGKIIIAYEDQPLQFKGENTDIHGEIEIIEKNGRYITKNTKSNQSKYRFNQTEFNNGELDNTIKDIFSTTSLIAEAFPGSIAPYSEQLERTIVQNVHQFIGYLKQKPTSLAALQILTIFFHKLHTLKDVRNMHPASYKNIARLINETGGFYNMGSTLTGRFGESIILSIAKSPQSIENYIETWKYLSQSKDIAGYKEGSSECYVNIKFLSRHKNIEKILTAIVAERKRQGITKKLNFIDDKSLIVDIAEKYNQKTNPDITEIYKSALAKIDAEEKNDPLTLAPKQKMRVITLNDTSISSPKNDFYFRNALEALYPGKIAGYHAHSAFTPASRMGFPDETIKQALVTSQIQQAMRNGEKLFLYINAHGAENTGITSLGNLTELITNAINTLPAAQRQEFIARNLIIGTSQCYGGLLLNMFKSKLGTRPKFMFSETDGQDLNYIYPDPHHKIGVGAKVMRSYYDAAMEYKKKGHWTKIDGTIMRQKPTLTRILHYIDDREKTMDARMYLRTDAASAPQNPPQTVTPQPSPVNPPRPGSRPQSSPVNPPQPSNRPQNPSQYQQLLSTTPAQFNALSQTKQKELLEAISTYAEAEFEKKHYAVALKLFDTIIKIDTKNIIAQKEKRVIQFLRGICCMHLRQVSLAEFAFAAALNTRNRAEQLRFRKKAVEHAKNINNTADSLLKNKKYSDAYYEYQKLIILNGRFGILKGNEEQKILAKMKECKNHIRGKKKGLSLKVKD